MGICPREEYRKWYNRKVRCSNAWYLPEYLPVDPKKAQEYMSKYTSVLEKNHTEYITKQSQRLIHPAGYLSTNYYSTIKNAHLRQQSGILSFIGFNRPLVFTVDLNMMPAP